MLRVCPLVAAALVVVLGTVPAPAAPPDGLAEKLEAITGAPDYKHASWGILIVDAKTGGTVYARNPDAMLAPASVTKLFTCAAALVTLGPDHKRETAVYQRGIVLKGTLRGDLVLVASGDLMLGGRTKDGRTVFKDKDHTYANGGFGDCEVTDTDPLAGLNALAKQVKDAGINEINGEVLIDDRLFARTRGSGSGPDAVTPIVVNDNAIDVVVTPGEKEGAPATVTMRPETSLYTMDATVSTAAAGATANIQLIPIGATQFAVRGTVPVGGKPQLRVFNVDEPASFARALFVEALRRAGVRAQCAVLRPGAVLLPPKADYEKLPKVAALASAPFKDTVTVTLKVSHNLYASAIPCLLAVAQGASTLDAGLKEERAVLKDLGVDTNAISFGGGAGGAQSDYVSARATVQLLQGMSKRSEWDAYKAALPILGVDGTLSDAVKDDSPARGKAHAKTGTLLWYDAANERFLLKSKALAGSLTTKNGKELLFCVMVNNVPLPKGVISSREGKMLGKLCEVLHEHGP
ncbi:D-alanyl-D-alanine carboxypeptidase precursor [Gemmata obscuriglobus]|uniref:D-alanyl-D-alanine carboxypeptidase/D-alanyl-D-alanine-endopeptidase n=1 Tax=Gemmata obscuriglobus TaxID=114 RepID=A0A2Z3HCP3_9BACT|nr:D-alanyl-D-alanine carboxypeptidase/D-alanyl-D-alanine-endopeptidase [Gemmata obscuriglobus]AWM39020.1 D-alanyl-D-alanine carboxypeptidase/D-alanyl-D-alanine-endopeptidase [Gemmata obscuriglobus]QEG27948.1 D-alanyl-D-alanine carboxypeptidase precursor [Gemmata obscuriglobus]VTS05422.1 d-alanyl-d-alanine carboxypeptidase : D-alanyl-D-alanine carboxypeptidase, serine-type, PBP4 family OS=Singulisphaera acidiphila (strain ATCC BAA-1392 / DSM 18658 / VKM B-2454 / MOB10) GN=Sinac_6651 PE=4 SV=1: P